MGHNLEKLKNKALEISEKNFCYQTTIDELRIFCKTETTSFDNCFYKSMCILMLQGKKETNFGNKTYEYGKGDVLVTSIDVPTTSRFVEASEENPCIALVLNLDSKKLSKYIAQVSMNVAAVKKSEIKNCLGISKANDYIIDAFYRLLDLSEQSKKEIEFLKDDIIKEIYFRLLNSELGETLKQINTKGTIPNQINSAITYLKENYKKKITVEDITKELNIAPTTLFRNFKKITSISPLQYQKQLRLYEAQRLMLFEYYDAFEAGLAVGYESATQFNREYKSVFGKPPKADIKSLKYKTNEDF